MLLPRQVMAGVAVKKWTQGKNTAEEGYKIRGECVWDVYVDIFYIGGANPVRCSPQWSGQKSWGGWDMLYRIGFARLLRRGTTWSSAVSLGRRSEACGNSPSYVDSARTERQPIATSSIL
jgi:hypothetical protein